MISAVFIRRPVATSLLMLGIAGMGVPAYRALPVSDLPNVDFPTLNVGAGLPELQDVSDDMELRSPQVDLVIDRDKAAAVGRNATDIKSALHDGLGPQWSSTIYGPTSQYRVLLELDPRYQRHADSLETFAFKTTRGTLVPLESIVRFRETVGPQTVSHVGQLPAVTISFD